MTFNPREVSQWYDMISEEERHAILASIPGCIAYQLTKTFVALPSAGQLAVISAYESREVSQ